MREFSETQRKHLSDTVARHDRGEQMVLEFNEEERRQLESNRRHWGKRLVDLDRELSTEPERYVQPARLFVSIPALLKARAFLNRNHAPGRRRFLDAMPPIVMSRSAMRVRS
jgi:hypothetical protein